MTLIGTDGKKLETRRPGKKRFTPVRDLISIFIINPNQTTPSGLALPEAQRETYVVPSILALAVGPDCKFVKEGDQIVIGNAMAKEFMFQGDTYMVIEEKFVVGVVEQEYLQ